jgi:transcription antitermination factor NusG
MSAIRSFLDQYQEVTLENASYAAGQRLRITDGELEDAYGTVVREKKHRIVLEIEKLGMVLYAEVPKSQVENP